jgi:hypothetical protein
MRSEYHLTNGRPKSLLQEARRKRARSVDSLVDGNSVETSNPALSTPHQHKKVTLANLH